MEIHGRDSAGNRGAREAVSPVLPVGAFRTPRLGRGRRHACINRRKDRLPGSVQEKRGLGARPMLPIETCGQD